MTGIEIAVGFLAAWVVRKAKKVGQRADTEVDQALDLAMDRLHGFVADRLSGDTALKKLESEAEQSGMVSEQTRNRVRYALQDTADLDPKFEQELRNLVQQVKDLESKAGTGNENGAVAGEQGVAMAGPVSINATDGSAAAVKMGDVTFGGVGLDPSRPGQPMG